MRDPRDSIDLQVGRPDGGTDQPAKGSAAASSVGRPYLQLWFRCSGQYARAYRNADGTGYLGRCPTCAKSIRFRVGQGGTSERFFEINC